VKLIEAICYQVDPGCVQNSELQYVFHLMYHLIRVTCNFKISQSKVEDAVMDKYFTSQQTDQAPISELAQYLA
jgi:hypothetical protein